MSKIICDVCGTSYPETAMQCPICGCVRPGEVKVVAGDTDLQPEEKPTLNYTHVKGGRFSKANVRKRNIERGIDPEQEAVNEESDPAVASQDNEGTKSKSDLGLTITVIGLLLAIVAVVAYIIIRFFVPAMTDNDDVTKNPGISTTIGIENTTTEDTEPTIDTTEETINTEFHVDELVEISQPGEMFQLAVVGVPDGAEVFFSSDDETVATVDENGVITAVSKGNTIIRVACGELEASCQITVTFEEVTDPTEDTTLPEEETTAPEEETTVPDETIVTNYKISHTDVTLYTNGNPTMKSFQLTLKDEEGDLVDVEWCDDKGICKIEGNTIIGEKSGNTTVYAMIDGVKYPEYSCYIIVWYDA